MAVGERRARRDAVGSVAVGVQEVLGDATDLRLI